MSARSTSGDATGYKRGARGIDGNDGEDFVKGRFPDGGSKLAVGKVSGEDGGDCCGAKRSNSALMASAKGK